MRHLISVRARYVRSGIHQAQNWKEQPKKQPPPAPPAAAAAIIQMAVSQEEPVIKATKIFSPPPIAS